jgi:hypothetical protein
MEPPSNAATVAVVPLGRPEASFASRTGLRARLAMEQQDNSNSVQHQQQVNCGTTSLVSLCLGVVVTSLEKYAPESFGVLSEEDFEEIIQQRHRRTSPKEGSGGLDGTGRVAPALSDKFLVEVELANPHLSESVVVDRLVWKDCVNFRFREGGLTRPPALALPWPLLVDKVRECAEALQRQQNQGALDSSDAAAAHALQVLEMCPMNVPLLQATGVGKSIRKCIKSHRNQDGHSDDALFQRLEDLLNSWMDMAESDSVTVGKSSATAGAKPSASAPKETKEDLRIAEGCPSWRKLFQALKERADSCRSVQGERMRKIRSNLARDRPKVVKVRPASASSASAKHARLIARLEEGGKSVTQSPSSPHVSKMSKLWRETAVTAQRSQRPSVPAQASSLKRAPASSTANSSSHTSKSSFGAAVAFAAASKKSGKSSGVRSANSLKAQSKLISLAGGKQMRVPRHNPAAVASISASRGVVLPPGARPSSTASAPSAKVRRQGQR